MKTIFFAVVSVLALITAGRAADMPVKAHVFAPPQAQFVDWSGAYLGIQGGVAHHNATGHATDCCAQLEQQKNGGAFGALLGFNWQQGSFVYGLEGDWTAFSGVRAEEALPVGLVDTNSFNAKWVATVRGRAGLAVDATLVYITGGVAFGQVDNSIVVDLGDGSFAGSFLDDKTRVGWTAGAGVEHMLSPHWTARGEWRYVDLGTSNIGCTGGNNLCPGTHANFSNTLMMGLVGLAYKF